ncbi:Nuclear hormone receptor family member nhr-199 [Caenorhabditis elegans]|uniref:Nuclear hormone receptor family member nhr-199 n=1 Tax=Caenorhabditis elegans TaxID=6239 RepID=NH199_CAEEL|nr:Nuclear hormone receptor family member nhr-199 [Caenorhabditis elegans]O17934.1 RecName: Full=Nuclear hormone receptor family member nhr-199 [Caenorhabditis elegans]CAB05766.1 Nuclear hormone receptor family member nhr-199 [Caenorhabditis elegans]|eukprot:NP_506905.1 Nuclear hormone receptor family member nhr-199 [Caenorhabditis elegans]
MFTLARVLNNIGSASSNEPIPYCLICSEVADGNHFGVAAACRACAAFFRRTVQHNKIHECGRNGQCFFLSCKFLLVGFQISPLSSDARSMCKACRYGKCLEMGMQRSSVQQRREQLGKRLNISDDRGKPVLNKLRRAYEMLILNRKHVHNRRENQAPRAIGFNELPIVFQNESTSIYQFLWEAFPEYSMLLPDTKLAFFKNFFLSFCLFESSFNGCSAKQKNVMLIPSGDYIDLAHSESFFTNDHQTFTERDNIEILAQRLKLIQSSITVPLSAENVDIYEFLALAGIILLESDSESEADFQEEAVKIKSNIIKDLLFHYQCINIYDDAAMRLGAVLSILPSIQVCCSRSNNFLIINSKDVSESQSPFSRIHGNQKYAQFVRSSQESLRHVLANFIKFICKFVSI